MYTRHFVNPDDRKSCVTSPGSLCHSGSSAPLMDGCRSLHQTLPLPLPSCRLTDIQAEWQPPAPELDRPHGVWTLVQQLAHPSGDASVDVDRPTSTVQFGRQRFAAGLRTGVLSRQALLHCRQEKRVENQLLHAKVRTLIEALANAKGVRLLYDARLDRLRQKISQQQSGFVSNANGFPARGLSEEEARAQINTNVEKQLALRRASLTDSLRRLLFESEEKQKKQHYFQQQQKNAVSKYQETKRLSSSSLSSTSASESESILESICLEATNAAADKVLSQNVPFKTRKTAGQPLSKAGSVVTVVSNTPTSVTQGILSPCASYNSERRKLTLNVEPGKAPVLANRNYVQKTTTSVVSLFASDNTKSRVLSASDDVVPQQSGTNFETEKTTMNKCTRPVESFSDNSSKILPTYAVNNKPELEKKLSKIKVDYVTEINRVKSATPEGNKNSSFELITDGSASPSESITASFSLVQNSKQIENKTIVKNNYIKNVKVCDNDNDDDDKGDTAYNLDDNDNTNDDDNDDDDNDDDDDEEEEDEDDENDDETTDVTCEDEQQIEQYIATKQPDKVSCHNSNLLALNKNKTEENKLKTECNSLEDSKESISDDFQSTFDSESDANTLTDEVDKNKTAVNTKAKEQIEFNEEESFVTETETSSRSLSSLLQS